MFIRSLNLIKHSCIKTEVKKDCRLESTGKMLLINVSKLQNADTERVSKMFNDNIFNLFSL